MKLKLISTMVLAAVCATVFAAPPVLVNRYVDDFMIRMNAKTKLTDEQSRALTNILYDGIEAREDIIETYEGETSLFAKRSMKSELEAANAVTVSDAREILEPKQFEAFESIQADNREKLKKRLQEQ